MFKVSDCFFSKKVVEVNKKNLDVICSELAGLIDDNFEIVVGIATGGEYVGEIVAEKLQLPLLVIKRQRISTKRKEFLNIDVFLKKMPAKFNDVLRIVESGFQESLYLYKGEKFYSDNSVSCIRGDIKSIAKKKKILIVDDAIDSGSTIIEALTYLKGFNASAEYKVAVLSITYSNPAVFADYYLYRRILLRMPWSKDARLCDDKSV